MDDIRIVDAAEVGKAIKAVPMVDVRPAEYYDQGHIPGAINIPLGSVEGEEHPGRALASLFAKAGIDSHDPVIVYCMIGRSAEKASNMLADHGYDAIELYHGSWMDWIKDPSRPIERTQEKAA